MNSLTGTKQQTFMQGPSCLGAHLFLGFFSWIAAFKIDFQKEVDPWCVYKPRILACDGTHTGVSVRNRKLEKPVTMPDIKGTVTCWCNKTSEIPVQEVPEEAEAK